MGTLSVDKLMKTSTGAAEFTLPATDGAAGQVLQTDGSGQLSVGAYTIPADAVGASQIAANAVGNSEMADDAVGLAELSATGTASATTFLRGDNAWAEAGGGKLLQMVVDSYTAEQSTTSHTLGTMPNLSTTMTLSDSANTILVWVALNGVVRDGPGSGGAGTGGVFELWRDTTRVAQLGGYVGWFEPTVGVEIGIGSFGCSYPDAPGDTSAHAYTLKWARSRDDSASYIYMNRGGSTYSSIICLEIGA